MRCPCALAKPVDTSRQILVLMVHQIYVYIMRYINLMGVINTEGHCIERVMYGPKPVIPSLQE
jgi:hypothetical protein